MDTDTRSDGALQLEISAKLIQIETAQIANCGVERVCVQGFRSNPCLNAKEERQRYDILCSMLG